MFEAKKAPSQGRPFAPWRIVVWLMMLLAAFGFVLGGAQVVGVGQALFFTSTPLSEDAKAILVPALAWASVTAVVAFATMVCSLATLRWREGGRRALRAVALVLIVVALWTAWSAWGAIGTIDQNIAFAAKAGVPAEGLAKMHKDRSILLVAIGLKVISVPVLAWLSWILGTVRVRQQFALPAL